MRFIPKKIILDGKICHDSWLMFQKTLISALKKKTEKTTKRRYERKRNSYINSNALLINCEQDLD